MRLEDHIRWAIYNYPTLYRDVDYASSRLHVLDHLFLANGNGLEWTPDGYLTDGNDKHVVDSLPDDFFTKPDLWTIRLRDAKRLPEVLVKLEGKYHYVGDTTVVFQSDEQFAKELQFDFGYFFTDIPEKRPTTEDEWFHIHVSTAARNIRKKHEEGTFAREMQEMMEAFSPYPLCQYAGLMEILNGRTNSLHIENFDLIPQPDWLQGCIEVAEVALKYYNNPKAVKSNHYHPDQTLPMWRYDIKQGKKPHRWNEKETIEEYAWRIWIKFRNEQIALLRKFLKKFAIRLKPPRKTCPCGRSVSMNTVECSCGHEFPAENEVHCEHCGKLLNGQMMTERIPPYRNQKAFDVHYCSKHCQAMKRYKLLWELTHK